MFLKYYIKLSLECKQMACKIAAVEMLKVEYCLKQNVHLKIRAW